MADETQDTSTDPVTTDVTPEAHADTTATPDTASADTPAPDAPPVTEPPAPADDDAGASDGSDGGDESDGETVEVVEEVIVVEEVVVPAYDGSERPATTDAARPENLGPGEHVHEFAPVSEATSEPLYGQPDVGAYVAPLEDNPTGDTPVSDTPNEDAAAKFGETGNPADLQTDLGPGEQSANTFPGHQYPRPLHDGNSGPVGTPI